MFLVSQNILCNSIDFVNSSQESMCFGDYFMNFNADNEFQCWQWISMLEMLNFDDGNEFQCLQCSISGVEIAVLKNLDRGRDHFWNIFKLPQSHLAAIWDI